MSCQQTTKVYHKCTAFHYSFDKFVDFEMEGVRPRGRPKKTCSEVTEKDCQTRQICKEDDMNRRKMD